MNKGRLEAFSDGVLAVIITLTALDLKVPPHGDIAGIEFVLPVFVSYVLSFVFIGIYWTNHHHLFLAVKRINGPVLWANLNLLFWLSLIPFATGWMGEHWYEPLPVATYGTVLLCAAISYFILTRTLLTIHEKDSILARALGHDFKGKISIVIYGIAIVLAFVHSWFAYALYIVVAVMWIVPDRRIEKEVLP